MHRASRYGLTTCVVCSGGIGARDRRRLGLQLQLSAKVVGGLGGISLGIVTLSPLRMQLVPPPAGGLVTKAAACRASFNGRGGCSHRAKREPFQTNTKPAGSPYESDKHDGSVTPATAP